MTYRVLLTLLSLNFGAALRLNAGGVTEKYVPNCKEKAAKNNAQTFIGSLFQYKSAMLDDGRPVTPTGNFVLQSCDKEYYLDHGLLNAYTELLAGASVAELGAGCGCYTHSLSNHVKSIQAFDGAQNIGDLTSNLVLSRDLTFDQSSEIAPHDWTICTEVGEHVPQEHEDALLRNIVANTAKGVILSWVPPGLGTPEDPTRCDTSHGHVNCQSNEHVIAKMDSLGFDIDQDLTQKMRTAAALSWFRKTMMVFKKREAL